MSNIWGIKHQFLDSIKSHYCHINDDLTFKPKADFSKLIFTYINYNKSTIFENILSLSSKMDHIYCTNSISPRYIESCFTIDLDVFSERS